MLRTGLRGLATARTESEVLSEALAIGGVVKFHWVVVVGEDAAVVRIAFAKPGVGVLDKGEAAGVNVCEIGLLEEF